MPTRTALFLDAAPGAAARLADAGVRVLFDGAEADLAVYGAADARLDRLPPATLRVCVPSAPARAGIGTPQILLLTEAAFGALAASFGISGTGRRLLEALQKAADVETIAVFLGAKGAVGRQGGRFVFVLGYEAPPAEPRAAEDAFLAGFLRARLEGGDLEACCRAGNGFAALAAGPFPEDWAERLNALLPRTGWSEDMGGWIF